MNVQREEAQEVAGTAPPPATDVIGSGERPRALRIEVAGRTIWQVIGAILLTIVLVSAAVAARSLLTIVAMSFFFSLALDPAVSRLHESRGWRRGTAVGVVYLAGFAFVIFLVAMFIPGVRALATVISDSADDWVAALNTWTSDTFGFTLASPTVSAEAAQAGAAVQEFAANAFGTALGIAGAGVAFIFDVSTMAMFTFYFTADAPRVRRAVLRLFSPRAQQRIGWTWDQAIKQTGGYFYSRLILMTINGIGFFVTMSLVGVPIPLAVGLAVFAGFVSVFIPTIGTYIGSAVPIVVTLAYAGLIPALVVLAYALVYQQVENYFLSPRISANTMTLNGGVAFGAALAGGAIAGPVGAFVSLPIAALISAVIANYARSYDVVYDSPLTGEDDTTVAG